MVKNITLIINNYEEILDIYAFTLDVNFEKNTNQFTIYLKERNCKAYCYSEDPNTLYFENQEDLEEIKIQGMYGLLKKKLIK